MNAREFRIGNYILFNNFIQRERLVIVDGRFLLPFNETELEINNYYQPIPLTEEWLLKFGFEKIITFDVFPTFFRNKINVNDGIVYVCGCGFLNHIKYVHQLQNLYFDLNNEELTLNN